MCDAFCAPQIILDATGTFDKLRELFGPYAEPIVWFLTIGAVVYTYRQSAEVEKATSNYETLSRDEAIAKQQTMDTSTTVFDKMAKEMGRPRE